MLNNPLEQLRFPEDKKRVKKAKEVSKESENLERLSKFTLKRMLENWSPCLSKMNLF